MVSQVISEHQQLILSNQDEQLTNLAYSMDSNINNIVERCRAELQHAVERKDLLAAEQIWRDTGDTDRLLMCMRENLLLQDSVITAMVAISDDKVFLSTDGKTTYTFYATDISRDLRACTSADGTSYLAFYQVAAQGDVAYAMLVDLDQFYWKVVGHKLPETAWILLLDAEGRVLIHYQQDRVLVDPIDAVTGATCGQDGVEILKDSQSRQDNCTVSYEYTDYITGDTYLARMSVLTTRKNSNGAFAVGVVTNFDEVMEPLNASAMRFVIFGTMLLGGVFLLVFLTFTIGFRNAQNIEELKILKEKNATMEELNHHTQELARHQRLETIGMLTSSIAHEFNNLLTPIMGYSILTLEQLPPQSEDLQDNILEIYNASRKAKDIISRLSNLSRKNGKLVYQQLSLDELIKHVLHVALPAKPVAVTVTLDLASNGYTIQGNETQLSQLILNLVLNAFQAMEAGGVLTVSTKREGSQIDLRIQDSGPGIPEDVMPHIFEPFFTTKGSGKGTGLGLAIVSEVADEHNAKITVANSDSGCIFTVSFPVETTPEENT